MVKKKKELFLQKYFKKNAGLTLGLRRRMSGPMSQQCVCVGGEGV